jgi:hypothetical protein
MIVGLTTIRLWNRHDKFLRLGGAQVDEGRHVHVLLEVEGRRSEGGLVGAGRVVTADLLPDLLREGLGQSAASATSHETKKVSINDLLELGGADDRLDVNIVVPGN